MAAHPFCPSYFPSIWKTVIYGSTLFRVDMIFLVECYVKAPASIPPDRIHFAAPEGLPAGDSVTIECFPEELSSHQPIHTSEESYL